MKIRILTLTIPVTLFAVLAGPIQLAAQHIRYKLIDIGTFGGPASYFTDPGIGPGSQVLSNRGMLAGKADTSTPDSSPNNCPPICFDTHVFRWDKGVLTDLGALPGGNNSDVGGINARGWIAGGSETGETDPLTGGRVFHAVLWKGNELVDLGTLGEGLSSVALQVNNGGQVVGISTINTTPDPFSFAGGSIHPFLWQNGVMRDLGTLGGPDAFAFPGCANERNNLVTGFSLMDEVVNPTNGFPTVHPFLWEDGNMIDLGTLGGTTVAQDPGSCVNNRGQVAGASTLPGDSILHPFFWEHGVLTDLGTLGGDFGLVWWLNDAGDVVGGTSTAGEELFHATLWRKGVIKDLGALEGDCFSFAGAISFHDQIVGASFACDGSVARAVLWDKESIVDLNTVIPENSSLQLVEARYVNNRGEIAGRGLPVGCDNVDMCGHAFLLIPCASGQGCEGNDGISTRIGSPPITTNTTTPTRRRRMTKEFVAQLRARLAQRYHVPGLGASPRD
jgi:probable HAF family extracellular repeat protein